MAKALRSVLACGLVVALFGVLQTNGADTPAAYPPATPFLRIETGMHTAPIRQIAVDAAERYLVTASDDKTARVWNLRDGKLLQVLRPPQGSELQGALYSVAISPDGATVALAGFSGPALGPCSVYLFDRASGLLTRTLPGFQDVIHHMSYSTDGQYLVVALHSNNGIRVYSTPNYTEAARDAHYGDDSYWAEFDRTGRLVTASLDGFVRLYDENRRLIAKKQAPGGKLPYSARFSPDGSKVAVGFEDTTAVNILSASDLSFLYAPDSPAGPGHLSTVAWSRDGQTLYAAGSYIGGSRSEEILSWRGASREPTYWPVAGNTITDIRPLSDGRIAFSLGDATVGLLDNTGRPIWKNAPEAIDYRSPPLRLSPDGAIAEFGYFTFDPQLTWARHVGRFDLARRQISLDVTRDSSLSEPGTTGLNVKDWDGTEHPTLNGQALPLEHYETSESLAISANGDTLLLGAEWNLRLFDRSGSQKWSTTVPGAAWQVNLTSDGRYAVAALGDGTIRWYRADNGHEVMGLFIHPDGQRWVLWTPEGFYDSSRNADSLIGYHINHGPDHQGEFVQVEQLKGVFYRPDLLTQRLSPKGDELVQTELARIGDLASVLRSSPPDLASLSPAETDSDGEFELKFHIADRGSGVGRVVYRIDGIEIDGRPVGPRGQDTVARQFDLPPGRHTVSATVFDGLNRVESRSVSAVVNVKQTDQKPALYVLAVGVSNYRDYSLNTGVRFAASDADTIATKLKQQGTGLFRDVITYVLKDANASRDNIEKTVSEMAARIQPADEFVLYLAGHGTSINGEYTFVPWNVRYTSSEALHDQSLNEERLQALLKSIRANKTLLLLDTCSAGAAAIPGRDTMATDKGSIERLSKLTGRAILAASSSDKMALEGYQNHGVFTYAVLEGLTSAFDNKGLIQVTTLADYIEDKVPAITLERWKIEQFPMRLIQGQTFPIGRKQ